MSAARASRALGAVALAAVALPAHVQARAAACPAHKSGRWSYVEPTGDVFPDKTVVASPRPGTDVLVSTTVAYRGLTRSTDDGCTWTVTSSLDDLAQTSAARLDPTFRFDALVARGGTVYATAVSSDQSIVTAPTVVTAVSRDAGAHWTVHEYAATELTSDVPRCTTTYLSAARDDGTVYLSCFNGGLAQIALGEVARCNYSFYVSRDYAATWQPVIAGVVDPAHVGYDGNLHNGCGASPGSLNGPVVDTLRRGTLWTSDNLAVSRSTDDGRTQSTWASMPQGEFLAGFTVAVDRGRDVVVAWTSSGKTYLAKAAGPFVAVPAMKLPVSESGQARGHLVLPGTTRMLVPYYDGKARSRLWSLDLVRRTWRELPPPPSAWAASGPVVVASSADGRTVYIAESYPTHRVFRYVP